MTGGITGWQANAVKSINLITNNISLSGWDRNDFLNYIKSINNNQQIIFNTLNCPNPNTANNNFKSFDNSSEFLKDIAIAGGGTYYNCDNYSSTVDHYGGYAGLVPRTSQALYATCNGYYPVDSQPPIESPNFQEVSPPNFQEVSPPNFQEVSPPSSQEASPGAPGAPSAPSDFGESSPNIVISIPPESTNPQADPTDSRDGYDGIALPPQQAIPVDPPVDIPPIPAIDLPPIIPDIKIPGPVEDAPPEATPKLDTPQEPISNVGNPLFIGGSTSVSAPYERPTKNPTPAKCDKKDEKITFTITSRSWESSPSNGGNPCKCQTPGVYIVKGTVSNPNCVGKNVKINGTIRITDKISSNLLTKYEGETEVEILGVNGEEIPKETPSPSDPTNPSPSQVPSISESNVVNRPNVGGTENGPEFKTETKGTEYKFNDTKVPSIQKTTDPKVEGLKDTPRPSVTDTKINPVVGKPGVGGLQNTPAPSVPGLK